MKSKKEIYYYGHHACLALFASRSNDIIRVSLIPDQVKNFSRLLKWCANNKKAYHILQSEDLDRMTGSVHHEGICILASELLPVSEDFFYNSNTQLALYLDGVGNPHNLGSILRTCAHFGVPFVLGMQGEMPALSPSAVRIAKGSAEVVRLTVISNAQSFFQKAKKKGFQIVGTSSHAQESLYQFSFPKRTILVLGAESKGMSGRVKINLDQTVSISGSGLVESLNVSVAAAVCLSEYYRQKRL